MFNDFFIRALVCGVAIAIASGLLGSFIVWRRMAYFGDTLAHASLLGVACAFLLNISPQLGIFVLGCLCALALLALQRRGQLANDTILGLLSHGSLAIGLVALSLVDANQARLLSLLFGDILAVTITDITLAYVLVSLILLVMTVIWRSLLAATLNRELAVAEDMHPGYVEFVFVILLSAFIAIAISMVGVLVASALLIIPAASARKLSVTPEQMAVFAIVFALVAVVSGLHFSLWFDMPTGPAIGVFAVLLFVCSLFVGRLVSLRKT